MREPLRGHDEIAGPGLDCPGAQDESRLSGDNEIEFVGPGVRVDLLRLARLEAVETDEQSIGAETVELRHLGGRERGASG